jgi:hypothetical protein
MQFGDSWGNHEYLENRRYECLRGYQSIARKT